MKPLALVLICFGCVTTVSFAQSECATSSGSISNGNYTNERIGLSYHIPEWLSASDPKLYPKDPKGRPTAILLALWTAPRQAQAKPTLIIMSDDPSQYRDPSAITYARRITNTVTQQHAKIAQNGQYQISGITFYRIDYEFPDVSPPSLNVALTGRVGECEVSFQFNATSRDEIDKLFHSVVATTSIKLPLRRHPAH